MWVFSQVGMSKIWRACTRGFENVVRLRDISVSIHRLVETITTKVMKIIINTEVQLAALSGKRGISLLLVGSSFVCAYR